MHALIVALLVVIALILLGAFGPTLLALALGILTVAPELAIVGGVFVVMLAAVIIYHAARGNL